MSGINYNYPPRNNIRRFLTKEFMMKIIKNIKQTIEDVQKRNLTPSEIDYIISYVRAKDPRKLQGKNLNRVSYDMAQEILEDIYKHNCEEQQADIHELLKRQIGQSSETGFSSDPRGVGESAPTVIPNIVGINQVLGKSSSYGIRSILNPQSLVSYAYLMLDSRYRVLDTDGTTEFSWNYVSNATTQQGTVNSITKFRDVISIRIMPLRIPYTSYLDSTTRLYQRASVYIQEFSAQSFVAHENRRFHFLMSATNDSRWINLQPENFNDGVFRFDSPITAVNSLTISFGNPLEQVIFDIDRTTCTFSYGGTTTITTSVAHNLSTGDRIYLEDFTTDDTTADNAKIDTMNSAYGHIITKTSATTFTIAVDTSSISGTAGLTINIYFGAKRMFIPLEIAHIRPE